LLLEGLESVVTPDRPVSAERSGTAAGSEGVLRDIITAYRPFTIMMTGQPNDFAVHIGIGKLILNLALAAVFLSRLFLAVDV
jgi:hypothetical protein